MLGFEAITTLFNVLCVFLIQRVNEHGTCA